MVLVEYVIVMFKEINTLNLVVISLHESFDNVFSKILAVDVQADGWRMNNVYLPLEGIARSFTCCYFCIINIFVIIYN